MKKKTKASVSEVKKTQSVKPAPPRQNRLMKLIAPPKTAPMIELIPISGYSEDLGYFTLTSGTVMDIFRVITSDLISASADEFSYLVAQWALMYRKTGFDVKLVALNAPTDTRRQQAYIEHKIETTANDTYKTFLTEKLMQLKNIQRLRTDRQFLLFVFAENEEEYRENVAQIQQTLISNGLAERITFAEKLAVLEKLNNKSATMQLLNRENVKALYPNDALKVQSKKDKLHYDPWLLEAIQPHGGLKPVSDRYLATGTGYEACITITSFPTSLDSCWLSRLMNIDDVIATVDIHTENIQESRRNINAGMKEQLRRADDARDVADLKTAERRYQELNALWEDLENLDEVLKLLRVRIYIAKPTYAACDQRVVEVLAHLDSIGYKGSIYVNETIADFRSLYQSYTAQAKDYETKDYQRYGQPLESNTVADGIPFHFSSLMDDCGTYLGTTSSNDGSVLFDLHSLTSMRTSYNGVIVGNMGSGKSTLIKKLIEDMTVRGHYIRGFDPTGEFQSLVELFGGAYLSLDGSNGIVNALEILKTSDEGENMCFVNHLSKLRTVFLLLSPHATSDEANSFDGYMQDFYVDYGLIDPNSPLDDQKITGLSPDKYPIWSDFVAFLTRRQQEIRTSGDRVADELRVMEARRCDSILRTFSSLISTYGSLFDGHTTISNVLNRQMVYFNIKNLTKMKSEVFDVQIFLALSLCWDNCVQVGARMKQLYEEHQIAWEDITRFELFFDESHRIINTNKISAVEQLTVFAREARKYFGGIVAATQSLRDYVPEGSSTESINKLKTFFELCDYKLVFRQDSNVLPLMRETFAQSLTDSEIEAIPKLSKGETILCLPGSRNIRLNVEITDYEQEIFSGGA